MGAVTILAAAQKTLEAFAGIVEHFGLYAATYGLALQRLAQTADSGLHPRQRYRGQAHGSCGDGRALPSTRV